VTSDQLTLAVRRVCRSVRSRSTTGGGILGGGRSINFTQSGYYPTHLVPSPVPVRYERTAYGVVSSAYPIASYHQQSLSTLSPNGAFNSTVYAPHYATSTAQGFGELQQTSRAPEFTRSQPLPYRQAATPLAVVPPTRAPRASPPARPSAGYTYQLPGYCGHVASGAFRFGKSYGRITADVLAEFPNGHRPYNCGATTQRY
jgi:hypothetical protein